MKKVVIVILICLIGCGGLACDKTIEEVQPFSYEDHLNDMSQKVVGEYKNTKTKKIKTRQQAIDLAKNEVTIDYNQVDVYFDSAYDMWMVVFSIKGINDACQNVYLNSDGITQLVINGG